MERDPLIGSQSYTPIDEPIGKRKPCWRKNPHRLITVEVVILLYFTYFSGSVLLIQQFIYTKVAHNLNYTGKLPGGDSNRSECLHVNHSDPMYLSQQEVQREASKWSLYNDAAYLGPALISTIFVGGFCDEAGRKLALILSLSGCLLKISLFIAIVACNLDLWLIPFASVIDGCLGGTAVLITASFSYICDVTALENRSFRVIILEICLGVGTVLSTLLMGLFIQGAGFLWPFVALHILICLNLLYVIFLLPETIRKNQRVVFFAAEHFKKTFRVYLLKDNTGRRLKLAISLLIIFFLSSVLFGKAGISILWLLNTPLCWNSVQLGFFSAFNYLVSSFVALVCTKLLQPRVGDIKLVILGGLSNMAYNIVFSFAHKDWIIWIAPFIGMFSSLSIGLMRAFNSKIVSAHEMGAMFASVALVELLGALVGDAALNVIYQATLLLPGFEGLSFQVCGLLAFIATCLAGSLLCIGRPKVPENVVDSFGSVST